MMRICTISLTLIISWAIINCSTLNAYEAVAPWEFASSELTKNTGPKIEMSLPALLLDHGFMIFSRYISPVDGDRCNMYPTCAAYSRESVEKHGFVLGLLLTVDRLIHEGNEMDRAPLIKKWDRYRYYDPVRNNDYWW